MSGGLVALLDDIATLARMAATSVDDVAAGAARTSVKAAGLVVDDTAVTPQYVSGVDPSRELPIIGKIALGSILNKLIIILPLALLLSTFAPLLLSPLLMIGGTYLCYEGTEKIWHKLFPPADHHEDEPAPTKGPQAEKKLVRSAILTDFILSTEIMVISLNEVLDQSLLLRTLILIVVAIIMTAIVYGAVGVIVKMDDVGLRMTKKDATARFGVFLVRAMPKLLYILTVVGVAAMLWVGGHILLVGLDDLGWHLPLGLSHSFAEVFVTIPVIAPALMWLAETLVAALLGLLWGLVVVLVVLPIKALVR